MKKKLKERDKIDDGAIYRGIYMPLESVPVISMSPPEGKVSYFMPVIDSNGAGDPDWMSYDELIEFAASNKDVTVGRFKAYSVLHTFLSIDDHVLPLLPLSPVCNIGRIKIIRGDKISTLDIKDQEVVVEETTTTTRTYPSQLSDTSDIISFASKRLTDTINKKIIDSLRKI